MPDIKPQLKLRATISIDIDAIDFMDAARIQQEMEELRDKLADKYVGCSYELRERRDRGETPAAPKRPPAATKRVSRTRKTKREEEATEHVPDQTPTHEAAQMEQ